jgi:hypothetical protein
LADGVPVFGATSATVSAYGSPSSATFGVRVALSGDGAVAWSETTSAMIDVQMAIDPSGEYVSLLQGQVDRIGFDPLAATLMLEGRDYAARLIEARTQEVFANRTASEIATLLAGRHGLVADVQATTTPVGRYWELEHDSLTLNTGARATTEWDLLVTLAGWEGFDLWVSGTILHFRPADPAPLPQVLSVTPSLIGAPDFTMLRLERALSFAGDISVTVKSWHSRSGAACTQTARTTREAANETSYVYVVPNLTSQAAQLLAQRRLAELSSHELVLQAEMPGELTLKPRQYIRLVGTGTAFDRIWRIEEIERQISVRRGFIQRLCARASSD